jgi:ABC-2 type transport system permease protein
VSAALFRRTVAAKRTEIVATGVGMLVWGGVLPLIYASFGREIGAFVRNNPLLSQFAQFGGGDLFTLPGTLALGFVHPFTLLLMGITAIGFPALAIAGEREKGTLEVVLARPISRRGLYLTLYLVGLIFLGLLLALQLVGGLASATAMGVAEELDMTRLPELWLAGWLLFVGFMSITFAASVMSDRLGPAIGVPLVFVLVNYLANAIGSIWPDVAWLQDYSLFNLVKASDVLTAGIAASDVAILLSISVIPVIFALLAFPRRDIAAPS